MIQWKQIYSDMHSQLPEIRRLKRPCHVHIWRMVVKAQEIIFGAHDETHLMPLQSSFQTIHQGELCHLHLSSALLCHCSPLVPSFLIVTMKQLADVTFNYGCISSGVVEAEPSQCCSEKKKRRSCITICYEVIYSSNKPGRRRMGGRNQTGKDEVWLWLVWKQH
ncbi:hypothetical protein ILYODFUR_012160 [Ilyodon furcidens]|uniref:Uncharacterized protein n=1 Tax=Ilyodon furcidens TaxID=33524 RepID=A0ABV0U552_9TELE